MKLLSLSPITRRFLLPSLSLFPPLSDVVQKLTTPAPRVLPSVPLSSGSSGHISSSVSADDDDDDDEDNDDDDDEDNDDDDEENDNDDDDDNDDFLITSIQCRFSTRIRKRSWADLHMK